MQELSAVSEYLTLRWIRMLEMHRLARYVTKSEVKKIGSDNSSVFYDLQPDVASLFIFTNIDGQVCIVAPAVVFYAIKHAIKEFQYDKDSLYITFFIGNGVGVMRMQVHPDIIKSLKFNECQHGSVVFSGYTQPGQDFVIEDSAIRGFDELQEALYGSGGESDDDIDNVYPDEESVEVINDYIAVTLTQRSK